MRVSRLFTHLAAAWLVALFAITAVAGTALAQESFVATHFSVPEGDYEVPPVQGDAGYALAIMKFDPMNSSLEYRISVSLPQGQTISMAHFHRGAKGVNGAPIHTINFAAGNMTATGIWSNINPADLLSLMNQEVYLNIHTNVNPNGQLRDQVIPIPNLAAPDMSAENEVDPPTGVPDASGNAFLLLDPTSKRVIYAMEWDSLSGPPTMAHFHRGAVGVNGPPIHTITLPANPTNKGMVFGTWDNVSDVDMASLKAGGFYANIHTAANQGGEVRGQILTSDFYTAAISPSNEVNPVTGSNAMGTGFATVIGGNLLQSFYIVDGATSVPNMAHIHQGAKGTNGDVVYNLQGLAILGHPAVWLLINQAVTPAQHDLFKSTGMYANFHTAANPGGEARGQLIPAISNLNVGTSSVPQDNQAGASALASWYDASSGMIHVRTTDAKVSHDAAVAIYSPLGTRVATVPMHHGNGAIQATGMPAGIYFVQLVNNGAATGTARVAVVR